MGLLAPGAVVAGYRIESVVGRGGMGVVYRARELELERVVALKLIAPELLGEPSIRARFLREARTAAAIEHPNVVPVHAVGERDGVAYLVMRFVQGDDLRSLVLRDGPPAPARAADMVESIGAGLDAIHRAGYIHRDVKPGNVLVDRDGHVYVTDFGLAKHVLSHSGATRTGQWVGTLDYVAPEQIRGGRVDARADVYALGGVLHFLLTGHVPFEREADEAKLWAQLSEPPPMPSRLRPELPRELDAVVARAMAKAPDGRFPSAGDLGRAARAAALGGEPSQPERMVARGAAAPGGAPVAPALTAEASTASAMRPSASPRPPARPGRRRHLAVGFTVAALLVTIGIVALASRGADGGRPPPAQVRVATVIPDVGQRPNGVALAGGDVWVTSNDQLTVVGIDGATHRKLDQHPRVGLGASAIVSDGDDVWVAAKRARRVSRIDARSGQITLELRPGAPPVRLAVGLGSLWVATSAERGPSELLRYDKSGRNQDRILVPRAVRGMATGSGAVWLAVAGPPATVERVDPRTRTVEEWVKLASPPSTLYYGGGYLWATLGPVDSIVRIDPHKVGARVTTSAGHRPIQIVIAGGHLFVTSYTDHSVLILDPRTAERQRPPLHVPPNPVAITAGDGAVWVTGAGENTLTRIAYR